MELIGITVGLIALGLLAMRYGADSRELVNGMGMFGVQRDDESHRLTQCVGTYGHRRRPLGTCHDRASAASGAGTHVTYLE